MSRKLQKKLERSAGKQEANSIADGEKVYMRFKEDKYFNDLTVPLFSAGKVYAVEGAGWISRWVKRGGEIVDATEGEDVAVPNSQSPMPTADIVARNKAAPEEKEEEPSEELAGEELVKQSEELFNDEE